MAVPSLARPTSGTPAPRPSSGLPTSSDLVVTATDVQIIGADPELQAEIRKTIKTQPGGETSQTQLQQDVAAILETGLFANASVSSKVNPNGLGVVFRVEPIVVRSLQLSGAIVLTPEVANQLFQLQLGKTVSPSLLAQSVQRVNQWYAQNGYTLARVLTVQPTREGLITVEVAEGLVNDIQVRFVNKEGQTVDAQGQPIRVRTQPGFVRQQIKLQPGQVFREDVARQDVKRLVDLGIFQTVTVTFEGDARRTDVVYTVSEKTARGFNFGGGYNDDLGLFATLSYQDTNFAGLGQRVGTNVQVGTRDVQYDARFVSPYRDTDPATPGYGANAFRRQGLSRVFTDEIELPNGDRVRERRLGAGISVDRPISPEWNGAIGVNYVRTSIRDRKGNVVRRDERGNQLSFSGTGIDDLTTVSFTATRDQRDNPVRPSTGSVVALSSEQSIPIGNGNILNNRLRANYAQFFPIDLIKSDNQEHPQVIGFNLQAGTVFGDLPPYSAFTLGGTNSIRGYREDKVAASRSYMLASAEYRFPIYRFIGGVAFFDYGSDLGTSKDVPGEPGVQRGKPGSGFGGGFGLRINSPIGIIRLDFGVNKEGGTRLHFGFGQQF